MRVLAVIPARYDSTRFPGKPLADLLGKPLIVHTMECAQRAQRVDRVIVATDDERIFNTVREYGGEAMMTSRDCATGSDRIAEVLQTQPDVELVVNLQGDEPMMPSEVIDQAIETLMQNPACGVSTAMVRLQNEADFQSPHVVKVVCDNVGRACYFSRSPIPNLTRAEPADLELLKNGNTVFYGFKHFGLYVYRRETILKFVKWPQTPLEKVEKLEQLRLLENGVKIAVFETEMDSIGVDTPEDMEAVRLLMMKGNNNE